MSDVKIKVPPHTTVHHRDGHTYLVFESEFWAEQHFYSHYLGHSLETVPRLCCFGGYMNAIDLGKTGAK